MSRCLEQRLIAHSLAHLHMGTTRRLAHLCLNFQARDHLHGNSSRESS